MGQAQDRYPTIAEEIHRKTLDALVWLLDRKERGLVTEQEYYVAIQTLFIAVSGLVSEDIFEMLSMDEPEKERKVG